MTGEQESTERLEGLYGPLAHYSEHRPGETICFRSSTGQQISSTIVWVQPPGDVYPGGPVRPTTYIMADPDPNTGLPYMIYPSEIETSKE